LKLNNRGFAFVLALPWIAGAVLAAFGYHEYQTLFAPGRDKKGVDAAAVAVDTTAAQAKVAKDQAAAVAAAVAQAQADHSAVMATRDSIDQNAAGFVEGAKDAIKSDSPQTQPEIIALVMLDSASDVLGQQLTLKQRKVWMDTVGNLIAKNADSEAQLAAQTAAAVALRASLDATTAHAVASDAHATQLAGQLQQTNASLDASAAHSADLTGQVKAWADNEPGLWARIKALGGLCAVLVVGLIWYEVHRRGITGTLNDAVKLGDDLKTDLVTATKDAPAVEAKIAGWWGDAVKDKAKFEAVKQTLRL
jgi:hypothetical protein